jgi:ubiquinone/menaquinone biosynthesis C-methylase UbiE
VRPGYPQDAIDWLVATLGLGPGRVAVDLAAGTGKLTRRLLPSGARVVAVEPLAEMRAVLAREVPSAEAVSGTAEALPLEDASVDAVTVGQAFHWFDAEPAAAEIARVLRPGGALGLIWNIRDLADPLQVRVNELLLPYRRETPSEHEQPWRAMLAASPAYGSADEASFPFVQHQTTEELADRIASISFIAGLDPAAREVLLDQVRETVEPLPQPFAFAYRTDVHVFRRT